MKIKQDETKYVLPAILAGGLVLRFWGIWSAQLQSDAALNSMRALGWFDFLVGKGQTSPLVWFGHIPWWGNLSFHDHPPLSFLLQKISFFILGDNTPAALLPFALAGICTVFLVYYLFQTIEQKKTGMLAALLLAISSYAVWSARTGYLEGIETFFIVASVLFFILFLYREKNKYLYYWAAAVALALLTKYTAVFLLPAAFLYLVIWKRRVFFNKHFWLSLLLLAAMLTPIIIYNYEVFRARGHFDAALSSMVGMHPADYEVLSYRSLDSNVAGNLWSFISTIAKNASLPMVLLYVLGLAAAAVKIIKRRSSAIESFVGANVLFLAAMFSVSNPSDRFVAIVVPFLCLLAAAFLADVLENKKLTPISRNAVIGCLVLAAASEFFYSWNTNLAGRPVSVAPFFYSSARFYNHGFEELDGYLKGRAFSLTGPVHRVTSLGEIATYFDIKGKEVVLFDERADWFSRVWYVDRYAHYYNAPIIYLTDVSQSVKGGKDVDVLEYLRSGGVTGFWVVIAKNQNVITREDGTYSGFMDLLEKTIRQNGIEPDKEIRDWQGNLAFEVFHLK